MFRRKPFPFHLQVFPLNSFHLHPANPDPTANPNLAPHSPPPRPLRPILRTPSRTGILSLVVVPVPGRPVPVPASVLLAADPDEAASWVWRIHSSRMVDIRWRLATTYWPERKPSSACCSWAVAGDSELGLSSGESRTCTAPSVRPPEKERCCWSSPAVGEEGEEGSKTPRSSASWSWFRIRRRGGVGGA